jgi:hypothetical protein
MMQKLQKQKSKAVYAKILLKRDSAHMAKSASSLTALINSE